MPAISSFVPSFYLRLTVFFSGAIVMVVELLAAKVLAPFFGTSTYTWTAVIGVTMVALALGYHLGGRFSDRALSRDKLYVFLALSGAFLLLVPPLQYVVLQWSANFGFRTGAVLSCAVFFFLPLTLLGMVTPFAVKLCYSDSDNLGKLVGSLYALSTFGSLLGTALTGFFLIPHFGNRQILLGCSLALLLLALLHFSMGVRRKAFSSLLLFLMFSGWASSQYFREPKTWISHGNRWKVVFEANSNYGNLKVIDAVPESKTLATRTFLFNDGLAQNVVDAQTGQSMATFSYVLRSLGTALCPQIKSVLCIGIGIGVLPLEFAKRGALVDAVEINPQMLMIAERFFHLRHPNLSAFVEDGRTFLNRASKSYDLIILDAFLGDSAPAHLLTREFFQSVSAHLTEKGVLVINYFGKREGPDSIAATALYTTLKSVFAQVGAFSENTADVTNLYFYSAAQELDTKSLNLLDVPMTLRPSVMGTFANPLSFQEKSELLLTDDKNPVEFWDLPVREQLRKKIQKENPW